MTTAAQPTTGRPKKGYFNASGKRVPGTTTITSRFKECGGLLQWAWKCGDEGIDMNKVRDDAADTGSTGHDLVHANLLGLPEPEQGDERASHAYLAYLDWRKGKDLKVVLAETPMVSEKYQFGGTPDLFAEISGLLTVVDLKTSTGIYTDYLIQVAGGYSLLWEEYHPDQPLHGMDLLRISKPKSPDDPVSFEHRHWSAEIFPIAQRQFILLREAYELDKRLKGLL